MPGIVAVIPARAGSKGIPGKNLRTLVGKPLIRHSVDAALAAKRLAAVIVTSDSDDILNAAGNVGSFFAVRRPSELAGDDAPTLGAVTHAVERFEAQIGARAGLVMLLQPTAPLRTAADIDAAADFFDADGAFAQSLISCYDATHVHPTIMYRKAENGLGQRIWGGNAETRRQDFEKVYVRNGAIYLARRDLVMTRGKLYDDAPLIFEMPRERSINVDEETDLILAEALLCAGKSGRRK